MSDKTILQLHMIAVVSSYFDLVGMALELKRHGNQSDKSKLALFKLLATLPVTVIKTVVHK